MTIIGIGSDLIEINRIAYLIKKYNSRLANRILHENELKEYKNKKNKLISFLAKRFAVKEAASKALGTGIKNNISFKQFELFHDKLGKPKLNFFLEAKKLAKSLGVKSIHVTLTDDSLYVFAIVIIEN
ncbi:holo-ACP synthase [Candidatus Tachikawaea gelatinosa]|uniref:Holo-[acyl-carrier-protein] synthase n=1 Tax=Candidatus Tachikawaea gelatinosa TaxID=1410383 RepID=A0A090BWH8_9ENTR|nr:holo-ACP synthase [Candidatus Tachikawaea gelatinosa]BAP58631.1 holo-[acyl-carrier-protein] synthase [Candidatus Tachikawaea gelatinosa]